MGTATPKPFVWSSAVTVLFSVVLSATIISAAPANSNNDDPLGSSLPRAFYTSHERIPSPEDNMIPIALPGPGQGMPALYDPHVLNVPSDNAILNYLLAKRLIMGNNKLRTYLNNFDTSGNEVSRKRSYSKYCAFNAVSCFGRK